MEKNIKELLKRLKLEMLAFWLISLLVFLAGEYGFLPFGLLASDKQLVFTLDTASICVTLLLIPLALKLFQLNTTRSLLRMNMDDLLVSYHRWSIVRLSILLVCMLFDLVVYYLVVDSTGLLCSLIVLLTTLICWPTEEKIKKHLESHNNGGIR